MKVTATDNLKKALKSKGILGELEVPVIGLQMGLPISFGVRVDKEIDAVNEEAILEEAQQQIDALMSQLAKEVEAALTRALKSSVWSWKSGSRDIYDTGKLASSVSVTVTNDGISVSYSAPYANIVHNGGYIQPYGNASARPVYLPARPWVTSVLYGGGPVPPFDFDDFIARNMK